jgi:hypothetical protein
VTCFGRNDQGQSAGDTRRDVVAVAAGGAHTCFLDHRGNVRCAGKNDKRQSEPYLGGDAVAVTAGGAHTCVLLAGGGVACWGDNGLGQAAGYAGRDAVAVSAGRSHTCALLVDGTVECFGRSRTGYAAGDATAVAAGAYHTCVLRTNGSVGCWGDNGFGQSQGYTGRDAVGLSVGLYHSCAVRSNGNVVCWGDNGMGQAAGDRAGDAVELSAGDDHTCLLRRHGHVDCFGDDFYGQTLGAQVFPLDDDCNGRDDDCDGRVDEHFQPGPVTCGQGVCTATGTASCTAGVLVDDCRPGAPLADQDDTCDGVDDDCDGVMDDDVAVVVESTCGVGACAENQGTRRCLGGRMVSVACDPRAGAAPADTVCNGVDDDCDGQTDEEYRPRRVRCGKGECAAQGLTSCSRGTEREACTPGRPASSVDTTCDGRDEDCDGLVDEEAPVWPTTCGEGACAGNQGERRCVAGRYVDNCDPREGAAVRDTSCDLVDDDCDGQTDEDYVPQPTTCGQGLCTRVGVTSCSGGEENPVCTPGEPAGFDETLLDGVDNDCDGQTDEDYTPETGCVAPDPARCDHWNQAKADAAAQGQSLSWPDYVASIGLPAGSTSFQCAFTWGMICPVPGCPDPDLAFCADPGVAPVDPGEYQCWQIKVLWKCPYVTATACPPVNTLDQCDVVAFYNQAPPAYDPRCADHVQDRCRRLAHAGCPATSSLDLCAAALGQLESLGAMCQRHVATECDQRLSFGCPAGGSQLCADLAAGTASLHPLCHDLVASRCQGDYVDRYCPAEVFYPVTTDSCLHDFPLLTRPGVPGPCVPWVESRCQELVTASMQAHQDLGTVPPEGGPPLPVCDTVLLVEELEGYNYDVTGSVSDPARFDCTVVETDPVHPHDQPFRLDGVEVVIAAIGRTALDVQTAGIIGTCQEFVLRKYWDYALFQAIAQFLEAEPRRVFQLAYGDTGSFSEYALAHKATRWEGAVYPFLDDDGMPIRFAPYLGGSHEVNLEDKNDYIRVFSPGMASVLARLKDKARRGNVPPAFAAQVNAAQEAWLATLAPLRYHWDRGVVIGPRDGWHWHRRMSEDFRDLGVTDEELLTQYARRKQFERLLSEYVEVDRSLAALGPSPSAGVLLAKGLRLDAITDEVEALMRAADDAGCFRVDHFPDGRQKPAVCDWAPPDFIQDVERAFQPMMERELGRCVALAPANLATLASGYDYYLESAPGQVMLVHTGQDPRTHASSFDAYLERVEDNQRLATAYFRGLPAARRPVWGESHGKAEQYGDPAIFGAGYDYGASWRVFPPANSSGLCAADISAEAHLRVHLNVLDRSNRLYLVDGGINADTRTHAYTTHLSILNNPVWQPEAGTSGPRQAGISYEFSVVYDGDDVSTTRGDSFSVPVFSLAGFNINMGAGYSGTVGMEMGGGLRVGANVGGGGACLEGMDTGVNARVVPFGNLKGFVECGVDFYVAELGIGGELLLIDARLPVNLDVRLTAGANVPVADADFQVLADADFVLNTMSGRLYVYLETFWKTYKKTFFKWEGLAPLEFPLFNKNYQHDLGDVFLYCAQSGGC